MNVLLPAVAALGIAGVTRCLWRERQLNKAFEIWDARLADVNDDVSVLLQADRERLLEDKALAEDAEVAALDHIWERPVFGEAA